MFPTLLIVFYAALFCFLINKARIFDVKDLPRVFIGGIFLLKILVGILYGHIHHHYFNGGDTFDYYLGASQIADTFFQYPSYYIQTWLGYQPEVPADPNIYIYPEAKIIYRDLGTYVLVHVHAIPQFFSFDYYNVHIVFVAMIGLLAGLNLYRAVKATIEIPNSLLIFTCFFMPSMLFWTSGLHKDVWVFLGLSLILLGMSNMEIQKSRKSIIQISLGLLMIALFRSYLIALATPALAAYIISVYQPQRHPLFYFFSVYGVLAVVLLSLELLGIVSFLEILSNRQAEFLSEMGNSQINSINHWEPDFWGFITFLPKALINVCFRPFFWNCRDFWQALSAIEIGIFWLLALSTLPFRRQASNPKPIAYFMFFYAVSNLLLIGLLVGNIGTIVRYRAIALGLLTFVILQAFDYIRLGLQQRTILPKSTGKELSGKSAKPAAAKKHIIMP